MIRFLGINPLLAILLEDANGYQLSGRNPKPIVDTKATKAYYASEEGHSQYNKIIRQLEFEILLLSYLMREDDGVLTVDELQMIKKHIKPHKVLLQKKELKHFKQIIKEKHTMNEIVQYTRLNLLSKIEIERGIGLLEIVNQITKRYTGAIESMKRQFAHHLEYL